MRLIKINCKASTASYRALRCFFLFFFVQEFCPNYSDQRDDSTSENAVSKAKRARSTSDNFCWRCHKESVDAKCSACPRSWHRKCMGGAPPTSINENWICGECATILRAENAETRSEVVAHMTIDHLCMLLKYIVERMRSCQGVCII